MPARLPQSTLNTLRLLLPALFPSWRFFDTIAPSPRIQYALLDAQQQLIADWQEFNPRPQHLPVATLLRRLLWNPGWNEMLFMTSCAERMLEQHSAHSEQEIMNRIRTSVHQCPSPQSACYVQFRLLLIERQADALTQQVCFVSQLAALPMLDAP
jgi:hypothetical protein